VIMELRKSWDLETSKTSKDKLFVGEELGGQQSTCLGGREDITENQLAVTLNSLIHRRFLLRDIVQVFTSKYHPRNTGLRDIALKSSLESPSTMKKCSEISKAHFGTSFISSPLNRSLVAALHQLPQASTSTFSGGATHLDARYCTEHHAASPQFIVSMCMLLRLSKKAIVS
jgi:hypothetical protein